MNTFIETLWGGWLALNQSVWFLLIPVVAIAAVIQAIRDRK